MTKNKTEGTIGQDANRSVINARQVMPIQGQDLSFKGRVKSFFTTDPYGKALTTAVFTSTGMATLMYVPELIQAQRQLGVSYSLNPATMNYKALQILFQGYIKANQGSLMKNAAITQREPITKQVDSLFGEKSKENNGNPVNVNKYWSTPITAMGVTWIDMGFTHYLANVRAVLAAQKEYPILSVLDRFNLYKGNITAPFGSKNYFSSVASVGYRAVAGSLSEKAKFAKNGVLLRGSRNYFSALGCVGTSTVLSDLLEPYLSRKAHPFAHDTTTSIVAAVIIAPFSNIADGLWRRQIVDINFTTLKSPKVREIVKTTLQKEGIAALLRGTGWGAFNYALAFAGVNMFAEILNRYVFVPEQPKQPQVSQSRNGFFASASNPTSKSTTPKIEEVKEIEQPQATGPK
ncbi:Uncharacterised protein [Legionella busanensis]|uniref:Periplasmic ligand-binding sensor domain protein n=1 Tax=Legionella busanensis TaxID=190655 RepID=A0A378JIH1_9GAMM|nr:hypothetical protein [Legionella busanensis]STX50561.1 Uncharacterised protein [Legionella busanensis]